MKIIKENKLTEKYFSITDVLQFDSKKYVILFYGWEQYAGGITGINNRSIIYLNNLDEPFESKSDALIAKDKANLKSSQKAGKDDGYGPVGGHRYTVAIVTIKKLSEMIKENSGQFTNHSYPSIYSKVKSLE